MNLASRKSRVPAAVGRSPKHQQTSETRKMSSKNDRVVRTEAALGAEVQLAARARQVLRQNDMGDWTRAAPNLYPHQWRWDPAFIAIGLAHLSTRRAAIELLALFEHQWGTGKVPHIVFNPEAPSGSYFPGPEHWACAAASPDAPPAPPYTSCLCQPPVHAIAALHVWEVAERKGGVGTTKRGFFCGRSTPSSSYGTVTS